MVSAKETLIIRKSRRYKSYSYKNKHDYLTIYYMTFQQARTPAYLPGQYLTILHITKIHYFMKEIIILGTGCAGCKALFATVEKVVRENNIDAQVSKQEDIMEIMRYNVLTLPAMVIDGQVAATGRLSETEVKKLLTI